MSSLDSGLNTLTTVLMNDLKIFKNKSLLNAKKLTIGLGLISIFPYIMVKSDDLLIENFYNFMSLFCAPILSLFLIGVLTKYACFKGWIVGLIFSLIITIYLKKCAVINVIYLFTSSFLVCTFISLLFSYLLFRKK